MGKRELLLILGFAIAGVVVYQVAAPPAKDGEGFSFSRLWNRARAEMTSNSSSDEFTHTGTIPAEDVTELQVVDFRAAPQIVGEERADITWELRVRSTGPTPQKALESAQASKLVQDRVGSSLTFSFWSPEDSHQKTAALVVRVPKRLAVRLQNVGRPVVSDVASVRLDPVSGETKISQVEGAVTGTHRSGSLTVTGAGSLKILLSNSAARVTGVRSGATIDVRSGGSCSVADSAGALEIENANAEITVAMHKGPIRIGGTGGRVTVEGPTHETRIEVRNSEVEVALREPVTLIAQTTDEPLRLLLTGPLPVAIEAVTTGGGHVQASEFGLTPESEGDRQRLSTTIGDRASTKVVLRNLRSDIVIRKGK
jgi:hypothetical protein